MINYIYDGSFEGLLTAIYEAYYRYEKPENILANVNLQQNLLAQNIYIETDSSKAEKVYTSIRKKISPQALRHIFHVFLSECEDIGTLIYRYLQFGWKVGKDIDRYLSDDRVLQIHSISQKVAWEHHRMLGLIRFQKLDEKTYYAAYEPDNNITGLIAPHFSRRLADQHWMIHDLRRNIAAIYNQREWILTDMALDKPIETSEHEEKFQQLWKQYFKSIAIESRKNPKLQKQFLPMRYWRHLVEIK